MFTSTKEKEAAFPASIANTQQNLAIVHRVN